MAKSFSILYLRSFFVSKILPGSISLPKTMSCVNILCLVKKITFDTNKVNWNKTGFKNRILKNPIFKVLRMGKLRKDLKAPQDWTEEEREKHAENLKIGRNHWFVDGLIDWLVGWLIDWLIGWSIDWLIIWLID